MPRYPKTSIIYYLCAVKIILIDESFHIYNNDDLPFSYYYSDLLGFSLFSYFYTILNRNYYRVPVKWQPHNRMSCICVIMKKNFKIQGGSQKLPLITIEYIGSSSIFSGPPCIYVLNQSFYYNNKMQYLNICCCQVCRQFNTGQQALQLLLDKCIEND